jgi:hypothetical protein
MGKTSGGKKSAKKAGLTGITKASGKAKTGCPYAALAQNYADKVIGSRPWKWSDLKKGATPKDRKAIRDLARKNKLIPIIKVDKNRFPAFPAKYIKDDTTSLPKKLWDSTDSKQFTWLNNDLASRNPDYDSKTQTFKSDPDKKKYTWHHHQDDGRMQLVEFGIHNNTSHDGGRTTWAGGSR